MCTYELENVVSKLEIDSEQHSKWCDDNIIKIDAEKCHFIFDFIICKRNSFRILNFPFPLTPFLFGRHFVVFDVMLHSWLRI